MDEEITIGIDLGTTNSCAAYYYDGKLRVLENKEGDRVTPSFLFFPEKDKVLVGKYAKYMAQNKAEYGLYEIKRLIGKKYDELHFENCLQYFSFTVKDECNEPIVVLNHKGEITKISPTDVSAAVLKKVRKDIETKLRCNITKAVITVPAYFNVSQREATLAAAEKAGFTVLKLLNEPTAAALSYYFQKECEEEIYSLVYDLGGGTFDVAILKRSSVTNIDIVAVAGDSHLGGKDFDNLIIDYVCKQLEEKYNYNPKNDKRSLRRLQILCEEAKITLSTMSTTVIELRNILKNQENTTVQLGKEFRDMSEKLIKKTIEIVDVCLKNSSISKREIKDVILVGGSTRIPQIQEALSNYFYGKTLNKFVNPDECVAEGAAIQAAMLSKNPHQNIETMRVADVIPLSLGIEDFVGRMSFVIKRNTQVPVSQSIIYTNPFDQQTAMIFNVYEGERLKAKLNRCLGTFTLSDITPTPPNQCSVEFTLTVDHNGILTATAKEKLCDNVKELKVDYTRGNRSDREIKNALKDAEDYKVEDEHFAVFAQYKAHVISYCHAIKYNLKNKKLVNTHKEVYELSKEMLKKVHDIDDAVKDFEIVKVLMTEMIRRCRSVVEKYNFDFIPDLQRPSDHFRKC